MYIKDSVIENQIEKDLKKQHLTGRIKEIENHINILTEGNPQVLELEKKLKELRGELELLSN